MLRIALVAAFMHMIAASAARAQEANKKHSGPLQMKAYTISDVPRNNSQPLCTVLVPADWRAESEMKWTLAGTIPFDLKARFSTADGAAGVDFFPVLQGFRSVSPVQTEGDAPPQDVIAALRQLAKKSRPKARLEESEKKSGTVEKNGDRTTQTGRIRFVYEENGKTFEEEFAGTLHITTASLGQGYGTQQWFVEFPRSIRAVKGKLDDLLPVGQAVCRSARATPELLKALEVANQVMTTIRKQNMDLVQLEGQMWRDANRAINDQWRQVCTERWNSEQKIAEGRRDILGSVHRFEGKEGVVIAPITYSHLWENGQGYYLLTNEASFRPGPEFKGTWTPLRPKK